MKFNAEEYWATREVKAWVVEVKKFARNKLIDSHTMYVRSRTKNGAILTAKENCFMQGKLSVTNCRLATPSDLGILS